MEIFFLAEAEADLDAVVGDFAGFDGGGDPRMLGCAFSDEACESRARVGFLDGVPASPPPPPDVGVRVLRGGVREPRA